VGVSSTCDACGAPVPIVTVIRAPERSEPRVDPQCQGRPLLLRIPDAARELQIGVTRLYELLNSGEIRRIKVGANAVRVPVTELDAYIARKLG
jgi:excisionase family DNA binding protein